MGAEIRKQKLNEIQEICAEHNCSEKIRKLHEAQYIDRSWHPHPSKAFCIWWRKQDGYKQGISFVHAFNCRHYHDEFIGSREIGAA